MMIATMIIIVTEMMIIAGVVKTMIMLLIMGSDAIKPSPGLSIFAPSIAIVNNAIVLDAAMDILQGAIIPDWC